jgi:hypothetical protein
MPAKILKAKSSGSRVALLLRMKDSKEYIVPQENLLQLIEFAKTFDAEIHRINIGNNTNCVLDLASLPSALCDANYRVSAKYTDLGRVVPLGDSEPIEHKVVIPVKPVMTPDMIRERKKQARQRIRSLFLSYSVVSLNELCQEFDDLPRTSISAQISTVRSKLQEQGNTTERIGLGRYQLQVQFTDFNPFHADFDAPAEVNVEAVEVPDVVTTTPMAVIMENLNP